jgi:polar amino acid transport system permease protein
MSAAFAALPFLWQGFLVTLQVAGLVVVLSLAAGLILGSVMLYGPAWARWPVRLFTDAIRVIPLLVLIFFVYYGSSPLGVPLSPFWAGTLALALFKTGHIVEITRGAVGSIHPGQMDAARAIGLAFPGRMIWVILPQALRRFLPPWLNAVVDSVKGSALVSLLGVVELMQSIQQVIGRTYEPLPLYVLGALIYFVVNFALSQTSRALERRFAYIRE